MEDFLENPVLLYGAMALAALALVYFIFSSPTAAAVAAGAAKISAQANAVGIQTGNVVDNMVTGVAGVFIGTPSETKTIDSWIFGPVPTITQ